MIHLQDANSSMHKCCGTTAAEEQKEFIKWFTKAAIAQPTTNSGEEKVGNSL